MNAAALMLAMWIGVEAPRAGEAPTAVVDAPRPVWRKVPGGVPPPTPPVATEVAPTTDAPDDTPDDAPVIAQPLKDPAPGAHDDTDEAPPTVWKRLPPQGPRRARPIVWRIDPFVEIGTLRVFDRGYPAFDGDRNMTQVGVGLKVGRRVGRSPLHLGGSIRYGYAGASGDPYGLYASLDLHGVLAAVRAAVVLVEGVDVTAALEAGPQFTRATSDSNQRNASDRSVLGAFAAKAGVAVYVPKKWLPRRGAARFTGGLELSLGYAMNTRLRLQPRPDVAQDAIDTAGVSFGDVRLHGIAWSLGLFARFM